MSKAKKTFLSWQRRIHTLKKQFQSSNINRTPMHRNLLFFVRQVSVFAVSFAQNSEQISDLDVIMWSFKNAEILSNTNSEKNAEINTDPNKTQINATSSTQLLERTF